VRKGATIVEEVEFKVRCREVVENDLRIYTLPFSLLNCINECPSAIYTNG
jgi:hypothetical protein